MFTAGVPVISREIAAELRRCRERPPADLGSGRYPTLVGLAHPEVGRKRPATRDITSAPTNADFQGDQRRSSRR
ncbi:MAG: hypothetical protein ACPGVG_13230, partial [Mycobacterium sp.]